MPKGFQDQERFWDIGDSVKLIEEWKTHDNDH
jgi:hypothetical protein